MKALSGGVNESTKEAVAGFLGQIPSALQQEEAACENQ
jgi:hypothetical protein